MGDEDDDEEYCHHDDEDQKVEEIVFCVGSRFLLNWHADDLFFDLFVGMFLFQPFKLDTLFFGEIRIMFQLLVHDYVIVSHKPYCICRSI